MTYSMTGFGQADGDCGEWNINVEIRTLNHRNLDIRINMPPISGKLDILFQRLVRQHMGRGRIEIAVQFKRNSHFSSETLFNEKLFEDRVTQVNEIFKGAWSMNKCKEFCLSLPETWSQKTEIPESSDRLIACILETTQIAIEQCNKTRRKEGKAIKGYLIETIDELDSSKNLAISRAPERVVEYRQRLEERISTLCTEIKMPMDEKQLAFEVALLADKIDVTEEFTRIGAHISALRILVLSTDNPISCIGKKIDFYLQELNREATTIASKSRDTFLTKHTIDMRTQIEALREQAANIQ